MDWHADARGRADGRGRSGARVCSRFDHEPLPAQFPECFLNRRRRRRHRGFLHDLLAQRPHAVRAAAISQIDADHQCVGLPFSQSRLKLLHLRYFLRLSLALRCLILGMLFHVGSVPFLHPLGASLGSLSHSPIGTDLLTLSLRDTFFASYFSQLLTLWGYGIPA